MNTGRNRRRFHRFPFEADASLIVPGSRRIGCDLLDLSINGALLKIDADLSAAGLAEGTLELLLRGIIRGDKVEMSISIEPAWQHAGQMGCRFVGISADSFAHLKTLIEDNLGDPLLLDRELTEMDYWPGVELVPGD